MDEVPIVNTNPVKLTQEKNTKPEVKGGRLKRTLKNFLYMFPLALIVFLQSYYLGKYLGEYSTFPLKSFSSYILVVAIFIIVLFIQLMMRSIVYSTLFGLFLIAGIYSAWFGDFYTPLSANFNSIGLIVKSAWSRKNLPFPLLMSGFLTFGIAIVGMGQFFLSLLVKSFFEAFFGKDWGDGRLYGYLGSIALLLGVIVGFHFYSGSASSLDKQVEWENYSKYSPIEQFITMTPGGTFLSNKYIWNFNKFKISKIKISNGENVGEMLLPIENVNSNWERAEFPIICGKESIQGINSDLNRVLWKTSYPASFPGLELKPEKITDQTFKPLTSCMLEDSKLILVTYDYGYKAMYDAENGKLLWLKGIDAKIRTNKIFPEQYLQSSKVIEYKNMIIVSCYNAKVKAIDKCTGQTVWSYDYENPKFNGKGQRAQLLISENKLLCSFKSGGFVSLSADTGKIINSVKNMKYASFLAQSWDGENVSIVSQEGIFYNFGIDGGIVSFAAPVFKNSMKLIPVINGLSDNIIGYRDTLYVIDKVKKNVKVLIKSRNHVFITTPEVENKLAYVGTQGGWIYCVHVGSFDIKWEVHVNGELTKDSLKLTSSGLLVKTKSGSLYRIKKEAY